RKRKRRRSLGLDDAESGGTEVSTQEDPTLGLQREDLRRILDSALDRLSPTLRATFVLFAEAEMSYKEIAELQHMPVGTVMSRLFYARQELQASLEGTES